jgi:peroxiredoxin Q/BCP
MLQEGDKAPDFSANDDQGDTISLKEFRGKNVVLYFYPKDDTTGCTKEACDFRDNLARVKRKGAIVLGVSPDSEKKHAKFKTKYDLTFPLIADEDKAIINEYGVWKEKSMYGREYMGVERTTFIIDAKGKIAKIFPKVKVSGHVDEVIEALSELA